MSFNFLKLFTQKLSTNEYQIGACLALTPLYLYLIAFFILSSYFIIQYGFSFEQIKGAAWIWLPVIITYYLAVFVPAYLVQVFLLRINHITFFSIIFSAILLTILIPNILSNLYDDPWHLLPIEILLFFSCFSLTFATTYWILLLRSMQKAAKPSNLKFPN